MSYFNFKLYTRHTKNVNTDLEYKKGDWAPGNPRKGGRAPILGYRTNLDCSGATGCQNETIYKDNWAKTCATDPSSCYVPVIKTIQNKEGKIDNDYNYNTRNLLRSRFRTYEQNAYNFDLRRKYASAWPTSFTLTVFATDFPINVGPYPQIPHFVADWSEWTRGTAPAPYSPVYKGPNDEAANPVYMTLSYAGGNATPYTWNLFKTGGTPPRSGYLNMIAYDGSHTHSATSFRYSYLNNSLPVMLIEDVTQNDVVSMFNITGWLFPGAHPVISNLKFDLNNQPPSNSVFFLKSTMSYGHLTNWGGGADPANNAYLIHDCSCNAPFTANNPCVATYKPSNKKFAVNNAVSGRSRINRLKYNTITKVKSTKTVPFSLLGYSRGSCEFCKRDFKPSKGKKGGDDKTRINSRLPVVGGIPGPPPGVELVVEGFEAMPGLSPSYITIQYNQSLGPAPAKENFTVVNTTQVWTKMPNSTNIITTTISNDTVELEFDPPDINNADVLLLTYTQVQSPFISNPAGVVADDIIDQSITAPIGTEWKIESAVYKSGGMITTCGGLVGSNNYIEITFKTGGPESGWATTCWELFVAPNNFIIYNSIGAQIAGGFPVAQSAPTGLVMQTISVDGKPKVLLSFGNNDYGLQNGSGNANTANRDFELNYINGTQGVENPEIKDTPDEIIVTFETSPDPIEDLVAVAGNTEVTLSWTAPGEGSSVITHYQYNLNGTWNATIIPFPAVSYTVIGLTNGTLYDFMVRAVNTTPPLNAPDSNLVHATPTSITLGTNVTWTSIKAILDNNSLGYTVYEMESSNFPLPTWYRLQSTSTPLIGIPYESTGEINNGGDLYEEINGVLILVIDSNDKVIWKINTIGDNGLGGVVYAYNNINTYLDMAVEYILYNNTHFPFVNISGYTSPSRPINGNSTGEATIENDWYNGLTADADTATPVQNANRRIVDDYRNNLGFKWVFVNNDPTGTSPDYNGQAGISGSLFNNPVGIWPSYPYPT